MADDEVLFHLDGATLLAGEDVQGGAYSQHLDPETFIEGWQGGNDACM